MSTSSFDKLRVRDDFPAPVWLDSNPRWVTTDLTAWVDTLPRQATNPAKAVAEPAPVKSRRSKHDRILAAVNS
jgi:hypothetical protein